MTPDSSHIVGRCLFLLDTDSQESAESAFDMLSRIAEQKLPDLLDEIIAGAGFEPERIIRIDRLEIDLGTLELEELERRLLEQIRSLLPGALPSFIEEKLTENLSPGEYRIRLLQYFLEHGRYPWWAGRAGNELEPARLLELLLIDPEENPGQWLASFARHPAAIRRLNENLQASTFAQLLSRLNGPDQSWWEVSFNRFGTLVDRLPAPARANWMKWLQEAALVWWLPRHQQPDSEPSFKKFLNEAFIPLAADRLHLQASQLSAHLQAIVAQAGADGRAIAFELPDEQTSTGDRASFTERLAFFLKHGYLILQNEQDGFDALLRDFELEVRTGSPVFVAFLEQLLSNESYRKRFLQQFPARFLVDITRLLARDQLKSLVVYSTAFTDRVPVQGADGLPPENDLLWPLLLEFLVKYPVEEQKPDLAAWLDFLMSHTGVFSVSSDILAATLLLSHPAQNAGIQHLVGLIREAASARFQGKLDEPSFQLFAARFFLKSRGQVIDWMETTSTLLEWIGGQAGEEDVSIDSLTGEIVGQFLEEMDAIPEQLTTPPSTPETGWAGKPDFEQAFFFLEHGRQASGQSWPLPELESAILQSLRGDAELLRIRLSALPDKRRTALRLMRQFSAVLSTELLERFLTVHDLQTAQTALLSAAGRVFAQYFTGSDWRERVLQYLLEDPAPSAPALMATMVSYLSEQSGVEEAQTVAALLQVVDQVEVTVKEWLEEQTEKAMENESPAAPPPGDIDAAWWYFLEHGRQASGQSWPLPELESAILQSLRGDAELLRIRLSALPDKRRTALRLMRQFSAVLSTELLERFLTVHDLQTTQTALLSAAGRVFGQYFTGSDWRERLLQYLLEDPAPSAPALLATLVNYLSEQSGSEEAQTVAELLQVVDQVEVTVKEWLEEQTEKAMENESPAAPPPGDIDAAWWYFLEYGRQASGQSWPLPELESAILQSLRGDAELLRSRLSALPDKRRTALRLMRQFSAVLSTELLERFLTVHDLHTTQTALLSAAERVFGQYFTGSDWRERVLQYLLEDPAPSAPALMATMVRYLSEQSGSEEAEIVVELLQVVDQVEVTVKDWLESQAEKAAESQSPAAPPPGDVDAAWWYFLEHGRQASGQSWPLPELESAILQSLHGDAELLRLRLSALPDKRRTALRLMRQFSAVLSTELLERFLTVHDLQATQTALLSAAGRVFGQYFTRSGWRERVLQYLLEDTAPSAPALMATMVSYLSEQSGVEEAQIVVEILQVVDQVEVTVKDWLKEQAEKPEKGTPGPDREMASLWLFLEDDQLPTGQSAGMPLLEKTFLHLLEYDPQPFRERLAAIAQKDTLAARLARYFSTETLHRLLIFLWGRDGRLLVDLLETIFQTGQTTLNLPVSYSGLLAFSLHYRLSMEDQVVEKQNFIYELLAFVSEKSGAGLETLKAQLRAQNPLLPAALIKALEEAPPAPARREAPLMYFLEHGRQAPQSSLTSTQLESLLTDLIREEPALLRKYFLELSKKANIAARINDTFSSDAIRQVLQFMAADRWPSVSSLLQDFERAILKHFPGRFTTVQLWQNSLPYLFRQLPLEPVESDLLKTLLKWVEIPAAAQLLETEWSLPEYNPASREQLFYATGTLSDAALAQMEQQLQEWQPIDPAFQPAYAAADRLIARWRQDGIPWWDTADEPEDGLIRQLVQLPADQRIQSIRALLEPGAPVVWLDQLPEPHFLEIIGDVLGEYGQVFRLIHTRALEIAALKGIPFQLARYRAALLQSVRPDESLKTETLLQWMLHAFSAASGATPDKWIAWLIPLIGVQADKGDLYAKRLRTALDFIRNEPAISTISLPPAPSGVEEPRAESVFAHKIETELRALRQLFHLGVLPPALQDIRHPAALEQLVYRLLDQQPILLREVLIQALPESRAQSALDRILSERLLLALSRLLLGEAFEAVIDLKNDLFRLLDVQTSANPEVKFAGFLLKESANTARIGFRAETYSRHLIEFTAQALQMPENQVWIHVKARINQPGTSPGKLGAVLPALLQEKRREEKDRIKEEEMPPPLSLPPDETVLVQNAGLVIVALFLPRLFESLGLLENRQFIDGQAQEKAVHLLQYLATGNSETPEHQLVLNKILCGMPLETPIALGVELSEEEKAQCISLLEAVLQNWDMMKSSTIDNLRGAFLLREGLLQEHESRWMLQLERKTYDIVLDYLPWTISMIKLPWMPKRMDTIWKKAT